jgi:hypothetical protein
MPQKIIVATGILAFGFELFMLGTVELSLVQATVSSSVGRGLGRFSQIIPDKQTHVC